MADLLNNLSFEVLKEPRGFIKIIEFFLSIFAFSTCAGYSGSISFIMYCSTAGGYNNEALPFSYPFRLADTMIINKPNYCNSTLSSDPVKIASVYLNPSVEFYVFVGVMAFLCCLGALAVYLLFDENYQRNNRYPLADLVITAIFVLFWLISSSMLAKAVTDIKYYTNKEFLNKEATSMIPWCAPVTGAPIRCSFGTETYASLNVSILFGFLNLFVWGGNIWFIYKETPLFQQQRELPTTSSATDGAPRQFPPSGGLPSEPVPPSQTIGSPQY